MKKITALFVALLLMFCAISAASADEMSGVWYLNMLVIDGDVMNAADIGMEMELCLNEDGTASSASGGEGGTGTWEPSDNGVTVTIEGDPVTFEYTEGYLVADDGGVTMAFGREKPAPAFVPADEIAAENTDDFNGTYTAEYIGLEGSVYPYDAVADELVPMLGATCADIVILDGSVSALGSESVQYVFENGMLILAGEGEMAEYTTQTVKMREDGSISYSIMGLTFYCTIQDSDAGQDDGASIPDEPAEDTFKGSWTLVSVSSGDVIMDAAESGMSMELTVTDTEITSSAYGDAVTEGYSVSGNVLTTGSGRVYTVRDGALSTEDDGVTMLFEKTGDIVPEMTGEKEYSYRVDSQYYTEVNGLVNRAADLMETGETQTAYGDQPVIEVPESVLEGYELDEGLSQLVTPVGSEGDGQIYIAVFVKHLTEYTYRVDSEYYTEVNGLMRNGIDLQTTGEEQRTYETGLTMTASESELEGYVLSESLSELEMTFDDTDNVYVFTAVYVRSLCEYTYRVDSEYYTEVNGLMRNEIDLQTTGEEQRTYETGLTVTAPESALEGYVLSESLSELEMTFDDTDNEYVFTAVYVRSFSEYSYRVDCLYRVSVDGVIDGSRDIIRTAYEAKTTDESIEITYPESALEGYVFAEDAEENVLSMSFGDVESTYVLKAVYIKEESLFIGRSFTAYGVVMGGYVLENEEAEGIGIAFFGDGSCILKLMGRELELEWTYSEGIITVDCFGEELCMCVDEVYLEDEDGRTEIQIEADMAGVMTVLFEESI